MNSPAVKISAPSPQPALELIALAQLSPDAARQKLRALLLTNPNYFDKIPAASFSAVLNIHQDTTYESISRLHYDGDAAELSAAIHVKTSTGFSSEILVRGTDEFVRFYVSNDGGLKWHDLGARSVTVCDSRRSAPREYEVTVKLPTYLHTPHSIQPKVRAILSWCRLPPAGDPGWTPVWGHVADFDLRRNDSLGDDGRRGIALAPAGRIDAASNVIYALRPMDFTSAEPQGHLSMRSLHSSKSDPNHRFLAFVLARAAGYCSENVHLEESRQVEILLPLTTTSQPHTANMA